MYYNKIFDIYSHLQDCDSKNIFLERLSYNLSGERRYLSDIVSLSITKDFLLKEIHERDSDKYILFGVGVVGENVFDIGVRNGISWDRIIDNNCDFYKGREVFKPEVLRDDYKGELIIVASLSYSIEMVQQLTSLEIPKDKIISIKEIQQEIFGVEYFEMEELIPGSEEVFVDGGAFDGLSTKSFFRWCKGKGKAYLFEADPSNIVKCKEFVKNREDAELVEFGLWNSNKILDFDSGNTSSSKISENGYINNKDTTKVIKVNVITMDEYLKGIPVTFIKLDIEGSEIYALKGAENTIRNCKPKLAISVYHKSEDIIDIPALLLEYNPSYKFYLRHYTFAAADTILYAI